MAAKRSREVLIALILGACAPIGAYRVGQVFGDMGPTLLGAGIFVAVAAVAGYRAPDHFWETMFLIYVGVAFGVSIDALMSSSERNLFPFEIVWWWIVGALPTVMGLVLGRQLGKDKHRAV